MILAWKEELIPKEGRYRPTALPYWTKGGHGDLSSALSIVEITKDFLMKYI